MADSQRKTAQLWDEQYLVGYYSSSNEFKSADNQLCTKNMFQVKPNTTYWLGVPFATSGFLAILKFDSTGAFIERISLSNYIGQGISYTTDANTYYININFSSGYGATYHNDIIIAESSTALPYEPYGWVHSLRKLTTATEAVENPLYSDGTAITAYTIKGNTVQSGTPTPSAPISVNGVGNKTANLFDKDNIANVNGYITSDKVILSSGVKSLLVPCQPNTTYTVSRQYKTKRFYIGFITSSQVVNNMPVTNVTGDNGATSLTSTSGNDSQYLIIFYAKTEGTDSNTAAEIEQFINGLMVNTGSTAKPYEPYGYKIPISSGQTALNPIYLTGQLMAVESADTLSSSGTVTYQYKKYEIKGTEDTISGYTNSAGKLGFQYERLDMVSNSRANGVCSHFVPIQSISWTTTNSICFGANNKAIYFIFSDAMATQYNLTDITSIKQWLADQYAAGTPVTIVYPLETAQTETVTAPSIPTTEGANSITVDTTVQPSEFLATWTGWHNASVKEYDGSQWQ